MGEQAGDWETGREAEWSRGREERWGSGESALGTVWLWPCCSWENYFPPGLPWSLQTHHFLGSPPLLHALVPVVQHPATSLRGWTCQEGLHPSRTCATRPCPDPPGTRRWRSSVLECPSACFHHLLPPTHTLTSFFPQRFQIKAALPRNPSLIPSRHDSYDCHLSFRSPSWYLS